jgi:hypothetical protein
MVHPAIRGHAVTIGFGAILALSAMVLALGLMGVVATAGVWRVLMIPAYLAMFVSALVATALSVPNNPVLWAACATLLLLPFAALDAIRRRHRRSDPPAA